MELNPIAREEPIWSALKRPVGIIFVVLLIYSVVRNLAAAAGAPLWYDEILTWVVASQPSWGGILKALWEGVDGQPFLYYAVEHASLRAVPNRELALRLPSVLAFPCTMFCVFLFARRRGGNRVALLSAAFLFCTTVFHRYAAEARPYSLLVACIAVAMVCYQRISLRFFAFGMGVALALAQAFHHYAVFSVVPFGAAEAVYWFEMRRFRWWTWAAMASPLVPLTMTWPIISHFKSMYGTHFWARYGLWSLPETYGGFISNNVAIGLSLALLSAGIITAFCLKQRHSMVAGQGADVFSEGALLLSLLLLPPTAFVGTKLLHGGMLDRYVLATVLALALGVGRTSLVSKPLLVLVVSAVMLLIGGRELIFWRELDFKAAEQFAAGDEEFVLKGGHPDLPVVVSDALLFLPLEVYASPNWKARFVYLADENKAVAYIGSDTIDRNLIPLRNYVSFAMPDFAEFVSSHSDFLVLSRKPKLRSDWLSVYLLSNASIDVLADGANRKLYRVRFSADSAQPEP